MPISIPELYTRLSTDIAAMGLDVSTGLEDKEVVLVLV